MVKSIAVLMDAAAEVASVVAAVVVETEADVVDEIATMAGLISLQKQPKIVGTIQSQMADGTTMPTIRPIGSRRQKPMIARNVRVVAVAVEVVDAIVMKANGKTKRPPTVTVMMGGTTPIAIGTAIADAIAAHVMKVIAQAETKDLVAVEVAIVAHVAKTMHVMIVHPVTNDLPAPRATIEAGVEEVIVTSVRNAQDAVVAVAADHVDQKVFQAFHGTATCRLGTMRSQESFRPTSRATVVDQEAAHVAAVDEGGLAVVGAETLVPEITPVRTVAEETTLAQVEAAAITLVLTEVEATTLDLVEAEEITLVLTEAATLVPAAEAPAAIGAELGQVPTCPSLK